MQIDQISDPVTRGHLFELSVLGVVSLNYNIK